LLRGRNRFGPIGNGSWLCSLTECFVDGFVELVGKVDLRNLVGDASIVSRLLCRVDERPDFVVGQLVLEFSLALHVLRTNGVEHRLTFGFRNRLVDDAASETVNGNCSGGLFVVA
jgi:hypothetical protein